MTSIFLFFVGCTTSAVMCLLSLCSASSLRNLVTIFSAPLNLKVQGTSNPPWGKVGWIAPRSLNSTKNTSSFLNKERTCRWYTSRYVSYNVVFLHYSNSVRIVGVWGFLLALQFFAQNRSPFMLVNVVTSYTALSHKSLHNLQVLNNSSYTRYLCQLLIVFIPALAS